MVSICEDKKREDYLRCFGHLKYRLLDTLVMENDSNYMEFNDTGNERQKRVFSSA